MSAEYIDVEIVLADLPVANQLLPIRVMPDATIQILASKIASEMTPELKDTLGDTFESRQFAMWREYGTAALPPDMSLKDLDIHRRSRIVFGSNPPRIERRPWTPERQQQLVADGIQENPPGIGLFETSRHERLDWHQTPVTLGVLGRGSPARTSFNCIPVDTFPGSEYVSREHLLIFMRKDHYYIVDLETRNGTYLNSEKLIPVTRAYPIQHNDTIFLGNKEKDQYVALRFQRS